MARARSVPGDWPEHCPTPATVEAMLLLQERWVLFVVHALLVEPLGFNELSRRATGVSAATLSQRLVLLEQRGILTKRVLSTMPPRTEYRLTPKGAGLRPVIDAISAWAEAPDPQGAAHRTAAVDRTPPSAGVAAAGAG